MNFESTPPASPGPLAGAMTMLQVAPAAKHAYRVRTYITLMALDLASILVGFVGGNLMNGNRAFDAPGLNLATTLLPLYALAALQSGIYGISFFQQWRQTTERALGVLGIALLALLFLAFYLHVTAHFSRGVFTYGAILTGALMVALRVGVHRWSLWRLRGEPLTEALVFDDVEPPVPYGGIALDARALGLIPNTDDPDAMDRIGRVLQHLDRVVVLCKDARRAQWAMVLKGANIRGEIVSPEVAQLGVLGAANYAGYTTLLVSVGALDTRSRMIKRAVDVAIAGGVLLFLLPLLAVTALAIRLDSAGPVFFVQPRLGRGNRLFNMYKFRSMRADRSDLAGAASTERNDDRVTRVGRLIRATSIDELPQILNVLRGEMSIVGPRPHALGSLAGKELFWQVDPRYWHRHAAKPGITGLAQVSGFRGATRVRSDLVDRLQADLAYLNDWTIWRDIRIILATIRVIVHKNAY